MTLTKRERAEQEKQESDFYKGKEVAPDKDYCGLEETFEQKEARLKKIIKLNF